MRNAGADGSSICPMTAVRSMTEPATGLRKHEDRRCRTVAVVRGRVDAECGDRRTRRTERGPRLPGGGFRLLNFSQRHDLLGRQATFALECRLGQLESRTRRKVFRALARQLGARQLRKRLTGSHGVTRIDGQSGDSGRHRCADLGVRALVDGKLAQQHHQVPTRARLDGSRRDSEVAEHALIDFDVLGASLCGASAVRGRCRCGFRGLLRPTATGRQRHTRHEDRERLERHRSIAALASRSIRANAASKRASRY